MSISDASDASDGAPDGQERAAAGSGEFPRGIVVANMSGGACDHAVGDLGTRARAADADAAAPASCGEDGADGFPSMESHSMEVLVCGRCRLESAANQFVG